MELKTNYPVKTICQVLDYARSNVYYQSQRADETTLREAIERLAGTYPTYGYRRITAMLKREGWSVNHKCIARLMGEMNLKIRRKHRKKARRIAITAMGAIRIVWPGYQLIARSRFGSLTSPTSSCAMKMLIWQF
jgi:transposase InsO family protein